MAKRKGLGRGLDALLNNKGSSSASTQNQSASLQDPAAIIRGAAEAASRTESAPNEPIDGKLATLPIEQLERGKYQPRRDMDQTALEDLAASIRSQGVMQPIVVRPVSTDRYEIIAGERRWRASQLAERDTIPAVIRDVSDETAIALALIENIQREDLNPMEEALALKRLQDEFDLTHQQVADTVGKSRTAVSNILRLLNLPPDLKKLLEHGDIEMGHARALLSLDREDQHAIAAQVTGRGLSVRQTEQLAKKAQAERSGKLVEPLIDHGPDVSRLEDKLGEHVGLPVNVKQNRKGKGQISFTYSSLDELDGLLERLKFSL